MRRNRNRNPKRNFDEDDEDSRALVKPRADDFMSETISHEPRRRVLARLSDSSSQGDPLPSPCPSPSNASVVRYEYREPESGESGSESGASDLEIGEPGPSTSSAGIAFHPDSATMLDRMDRAVSTVQNLLSHCHEDADEDFARLAIEHLLKKLKDKPDERDALVEAVTSKGALRTGCVTIRRMKHGHQLRVAGRRDYPHVMFCEIWRSPDLDRYDLKHVECCQYPFGSKCELVCVNPYHYEMLPDDNTGAIQRRRYSEFGFADDAMVESLIRCRQEGVGKEFARSVTEHLVRKLSQTPDELTALIEAVTQDGGQNAKCVTVQRTTDGRVTVGSRKSHLRGFPHVLSCQVWRSPDLDRHDLKHLEHCQHPFDSKSELVCVNPYHYEIQRNSNENVQRRRCSEFGIADYTIVESLTCHRKEGVDEEFALRAIEHLLKKLSDKPDKRDALIEAVRSNGVVVTGCVTIPRLVRCGQLRIAGAGRAQCPHVMFCRIWRSPDLGRHDLRHVEHCQHPFDSKSDLVCVNPYHYEIRQNPHLTKIQRMLVSERALVATNTVESLLSLRHVDVDKEFARFGIEYFVKKLCEKWDELAALMEALAHSGMQATKCVTIQRPVRCRMQVKDRNGHINNAYVHVVACQIWRFPNVNRYDLTHVEHCQHPFDSKSKLVCMNPYHYSIGGDAKPAQANESSLPGQERKQKTKSNSLRKQGHKSTTDERIQPSLSQRGTRRSLRRSTPILDLPSDDTGIDFPMDENPLNETTSDIDSTHESGALCTSTKTSVTAKNHETRRSSFQMRDASLEDANTAVEATGRHANTAAHVISDSLMETRQTTGRTKPRRKRRGSSTDIQPESGKKRRRLPKELNSHNSLEAGEKRKELITNPNTVEAQAQLCENTTSFLENELPGVTSEPMQQNATSLVSSIPLDCVPVEVAKEAGAVKNTVTPVTRQDEDFSNVNAESVDQNESTVSNEQVGVQEVEEVELCVSPTWVSVHPEGDRPAVAGSSTAEYDPRILANADVPIPAPSPMSRASAPIPSSAGPSGARNSDVGPRSTDLLNSANRPSSGNRPTSADERSSADRPSAACAGALANANEDVPTPAPTPNPPPSTGTPFEASPSNAQLNVGPSSKDLPNSADRPSSKNQPSATGQPSSPSPPSSADLGTLTNAKADVPIPASTLIPLASSLIPSASSPCRAPHLDFRPSPTNIPNSTGRRSYEGRPEPHAADRPSSDDRPASANTGDGCRDIPQDVGLAPSLPNWNVTQNAVRMEYLKLASATPNRWIKRPDPKCLDPAVQAARTIEIATHASKLAAPDTAGSSPHREEFTQVLLSTEFHEYVKEKNSLIQTRFMTYLIHGTFSLGCENVRRLATYAVHFTRSQEKGQDDQSESSLCKCLE